MKLEHFALNIADPRAMAAWYEANLGLRTVRKQEAAPFTHFLADDSGRFVAEVEKMPELLHRMVIALVHRLHASVESCSKVAAQVEEAVKAIELLALPLAK